LQLIEELHDEQFGPFDKAEEYAQHMRTEFEKRSSDSSSSEEEPVVTTFESKDFGRYLFFHVRFVCF
jgi:hypothetical protein